MPDLFPGAVGFTIGNETYVRHGQVVSLFEDPVTGECSNWGISLKWLRGLKPFATADDIKALTKEGATYLYAKYFWEPAHLDLLAGQKIASKVFDAEVNMGHSQGTRLLQAGLGVHVDGMLGPLTAAACNAQDPETTYAAFVRCAADRYQKIRDAQVEEYGQEVADKNLKTWLDRLAKVPQ